MPPSSLVPDLLSLVQVHAPTLFRLTIQGASQPPMAITAAGPGGPSPLTLKPIDADSANQLWIMIGQTLTGGSGRCYLFNMGTQMYAKADDAQKPVQLTASAHEATAWNPMSLGQSSGTYRIFSPASNLSWNNWGGGFNDGSAVHLYSDTNANSAWQVQSLAAPVQGAAQAAAPAPPPATRETLTAGQVLPAGTFLADRQGRYFFGVLPSQQAPGTSVLGVFAGTPASPQGLSIEFCRGPQAMRLIHQDDGNLVAYGPDDRALWATGTDLHQPTFSIMQSDGNLCVYRGPGPDRNAGFLWGSLQHGGATAGYKPMP